jgi:hypothetical protein
VSKGVVQDKAPQLIDVVRHGSALRFWLTMMGFKEANLMKECPACSPGILIRNAFHVVGVF